MIAQIIGVTVGTARPAVGGVPDLVDMSAVVAGLPGRTTTRASR